MGFCLLNNVAVAAAHARARGLERVAVVDWDVHHGNGTQEIFWTDPERALRLDPPVPLLSGHRRRRRGRRRRRAAGYTVNVPLAAGGGDAVYASAFERVVLPVVESYAPELILVSAGFDASARDPLAQMELSANAFGWMARELARLAASIGQGTHGPRARRRATTSSRSKPGLRSAVDGMLAGRADDIDGDPGPRRGHRARKRNGPRRPGRSVG